MNSNLKTFIQKFEENKYNVFAELPEIIALSGLNKIFKNYNIFDTFATLYDDVGNTIQQKLMDLKKKNGHRTADNLAVTKSSAVVLF